MKVYILQISFKLNTIIIDLDKYNTSSTRGCSKTLINYPTQAGSQIIQKTLYQYQDMCKTLFNCSVK